MSLKQLQNMLDNKAFDPLKLSNEQVDQMDQLFGSGQLKGYKNTRELMEERDCLEIDDKAEELIIEMVFQLGRTGVSKFNNMWKCLSEQNYIGASFEMLDSRWAKQTPNRAKSMANQMKACG